MKKIVSATCLAVSLLLPLAGHATPADTAAIEKLLDAYTHSVSVGDQQAFEALLLDRQIPFHGLNSGKAALATPALAGMQNYAGFRKAVFQSGRHLAQRFYDVQIAQDGDLAQVALRFDTIEVATGSGGRGWKTLALLKVENRWKIASEFYTVYPMVVDPAAPAIEAAPSHATK